MRGQAFHFGTVGAPISTPKKPGGSVGAILRLVELGLDALELGWVQSVRVSEETCALIRQTVRAERRQDQRTRPIFHQSERIRMRNGRNRASA